MERLAHTPTLGFPGNPLLAGGCLAFSQLLRGTSQLATLLLDGEWHPHMTGARVIEHGLPKDRGWERRL